MRCARIEARGPRGLCSASTCCLWLCTLRNRSDRPSCPCRAESLARKRAEEELGRKAAEAEKRAALSESQAADMAAAAEALRGSFDEDIPKLLGGGVLSFVAGCVPLSTVGRRRPSAREHEPKRDHK